MNTNKFIIYCFFAILLITLMLYPVNYMLVKFNVISVINNSSKKINYRDTGPFSDISNKLEQIKFSFDNRVTRYYPFYSIFNKTDKDMNTIFNQLLYNKLLNLQYYPVGKNSDGEYIYRNNEHYILQNNLPTNELDNRIVKQLDFFNNLDIGEINIFIPYRFEYTNIDNGVYLRNMSEYIEKFKRGVNKKIHIGEFLVNNREDYLKYFYKTDHHYNMYGAYEAYKIIMDMFGETAKPAAIVDENITYYGSIAKSSYSKKIKDSFYTLSVDLGNYDVLVNDKKEPRYKPKKILNSNMDFYDYYVSYFNGLFGKVEYDFHNEDKDNLLILEDSYGWQIDDLIASHFNKTYVIDVRNYEYKNGKLNIKNFMKENNISKVLFLYEAGTIFFDQYDYGIIDKVVS